MGDAISFISEKIKLRSHRWLSAAGPSWRVLWVTQSLDGAITAVAKSSVRLLKRVPNKREVVGVVFSSDVDLTSVMEVEVRAAAVAALQGQSGQLNACRSAAAARPVTLMTCGRDFAADKPKVPWDSHHVSAAAPPGRHGYQLKVHLL